METSNRGVVGPPKISIITVAFNSEETIFRTIESVLNQTLPPYEYTIVDGLSKDNTVVIAESYRKQFEDKGIKYTVISEKDEGIYDAMNKGIAYSTGDIIGMINSDDWYEVAAIKQVAKVYTEKPFDLFYADLRLIKASGETITVKKAKDSSFLTTRNWNHPTTFITKESYNKYQYANKTIYDDWDLILRLKKSGCKTAILNEVLATFQFGGVSNEKGFKKAIERIKLKYKIYRQNNCSRFYIFDCILIESAKLILG